MTGFLKFKNLSISQRNARLLLCVSALRGSIFFLPVVILFFKDELGLSFRDFMLVEAIFCATMILMEIPSGWLSDLFGRRKTLVTGMTFTATGFTCLIFADSFLTAALSEVLTGIGVALVSGTNSAMMYDSLQQDGRQSEYSRYEGAQHGVGLYGIAIASALGGFLYQLDHYLPVILTVVAQLVGAACAFLTVEPERDYRAAEKHPLVDMVETMTYALHGHREIAGVILFSTVTFATTKAILWVQQPYYTLLELPEYWFGILACTGFLLGGLGGHLGHRLDGRVRNRTMFYVMMALLMAACIAVAFVKSPFVIPLILIGSVIWGFGWPRVQAAINIRVSSERRATILSTAHLMISLAFIPLAVALGVITDAHGIQNGALMLSVVLLTGGTLGLGIFLANAHKIRPRQI